MADISILGISGSLRAESLNRKLIREAARLSGAASYTEADLRVPLYDGDLEAGEGIPAAVQTLANQIASADAVVISTPEYNKSLSGVLKNALDWVSRTEGAPWAGKPVAIMSATAGRTGGERAQTALMQALVSFRPNLMIGPEVLVAGASNHFDDAGRLTSETYEKSLSELMVKLVSAI